MISRPDWIKAEVKPYMHQISIDCLKKLVECIQRFNNDEIDADSLYKIQKQILIDEIGDEEFLAYAVENFSGLMGYIVSGKANIRLHRDIEGKIWFGAE